MDAVNLNFKNRQTDLINIPQITLFSSKNTSQCLLVGALFTM